MDLALFGVQKLELFILVLVRTAAIFTLTPIFGANQVPPHVRIAVALALTMVFVPMVTPAGGLPADVLTMAAMVAREACVGITIGFVCSLVFAAIQIAGQYIDLQAGFSFGSMLDPAFNSQTAVAGRFHQLLAGLLFFATNAHHVMIRGVADSFDLAPVGQLAMNPAMTGGMVDLFSSLFAMAMRIAVPVVAAVFLADVALAITARVVPQMNVLIVGLPLKLGVGLVGMVIAVPMVASMSEGMFGDMYHQMGNMVRLLAVH